MVRSTSFAFLLLASALAQSAQAVEFPYTANVITAEAYAMSGPGMVGEYRTERLERGQRVTVYQQQPGWCAIRPTHGSYSWVEGRMLEMVNGETARVKQAKVPSFIGSHLQARRDRQQVSLSAGELVQVVEITETTQGTWMKISPPAGEFRWVSSAELNRDANDVANATIANPALTTKAPTNDPPPVYQHAPSESLVTTTLTPPSTGLNAATPADAPPPLAGPGQIAQWQAADSSRWKNLNPGTIVSTAGNGEVLAQAHAALPVAGPSATSSPISTVPLGGPPATIPTTTRGTLATPAGTAPGPSPIQNQLEALEMDLASMLTEEPTAWSFGTFNQRSDQLLDQAGSALERGKVRMFQNKIARFAEIKQRSLDQQALAGIPRTRGTTAATVAGSSPFALPKSSTDWVPGARAPTTAPGSAAGMVTAKTATSISDPLLGRYDGIGKLMPVVAKRPNAPKFALVDANNNVVTFVTPGPGVDMQAYVGQQIGIMGEKGYMPELKKSHITAATVGPTDPATIARMRADQRFR